MIIKKKIIKSVDLKYKKYSHNKIDVLRYLFLLISAFLKKNSRAGVNVLPDFSVPHTHTHTCTRTHNTPNSILFSVDV